MKKVALYLILCIVLAVLLTGCKSDKSKETQASVASNSSYVGIWQIDYSSMQANGIVPEGDTYLFNSSAIYDFRKDGTIWEVNTVYKEYTINPYYPDRITLNGQNQEFRINGNVLELPTVRNIPTNVNKSESFMSYATTTKEIIMRFNRITGKDGLPGKWKLDIDRYWNDYMALFDSPEDREYYLSETTDINEILNSKEITYEFSEDGTVSASNNSKVGKWRTNGVCVIDYDKIAYNSPMQLFVTKYDDDDWFYADYVTRLSDVTPNPNATPTPTPTPSPTPSPSPTPQPSELRAVLNGDYMRLEQANNDYVLLLKRVE